jgi:hypothetical protein
MGRIFLGVGLAPFAFVAQTMRLPRTIPQRGNEPHDANSITLAVVAFLNYERLLQLMHPIDKVHNRAGLEEAGVRKKRREVRNSEEKEAGKRR